ncbi:MAG: GTPase Era [Alphaproteobacteria bacterium]|nr:GTPase Era [Alphaproteobacteria bacterium]NCQ89012.1 GTPase Era [Alphaproteobacteria bacterium]NCT07913.1 GTPase Era [Alphaproteobacteria bacterium]
MSEHNQKFGFVAVAGAPNAGKSTLINALVGAKVSIVSPKVQTTRTRVLGIALHENAQIVFVDTPGIFQPSQNNKLEKAIVSAAWEGVEDSETLLLMVDASKKSGKATQYILDHLKDGKARKTILVLNKIDKVRRAELLDISQKLNESFDFEATFMISALKEDGTKQLLSYLASQMADEQWHYPEDHITDMPMRLMAAEVTREKLFYKLHQELPYNLTVETDTWENFENGDIKIEQTIYVTRDTHKKIILGKDGAMIKQVGQQSRQELSTFMETPVHLKLFVKVRENWQDDAERYSMWGLDPKASS